MMTQEALNFFQFISENRKTSRGFKINKSGLCACVTNTVSPDPFLKVDNLRLNHVVQLHDLASYLDVVCVSVYISFWDEERSKKV